MLLKHAKHNDRERLGRNGLELARTKYTEELYAEEFEKMVAALLGG